MSKKNVFVSAYNTLKSEDGFATLKRGAVVSKLASAAGISAACASTYLSNVRSGKWSATVEEKAPKAKKAGLTIEEVSAMTGKALVEAYNKKAEVKVAKFRDRATGLKRVMSLYGLTS
jgi:hypothetical protein